MKKIPQLVLVLLCLFVYSCEELDGIASDTIKLSKTKLTFDSGASSEIITARNGSWWIESMKIDGESFFDFKQSEWNKDLKYTGGWFSLKKEGATIEISVVENTTGKQRELYLGLQAGNWFGSNITVIQGAGK